MKTIQELYSEIMANQELKEQFIEAANAGKQEEFLKAHGCEATMEEVQAFLEAKQNEDAPLSFDELENAAGGECNRKTGGETVISIITVALGCALKVIISVTGAVDETHHVDQEKEGEGRLCNEN
jgi:hypothetical protein